MKAPATKVTEPVSVTFEPLPGELAPDVLFLSSVYAQRLVQPGDQFKSYLYVGRVAQGSFVWTGDTRPERLSMSVTVKGWKCQWIADPLWRLAEACEGGLRVPFQGALP